MRRGRAARRMALAAAALVAGAGLALAALGEEECAATGGGCTELPVYPACEYSCNEAECIGPNSGNKKQIWPACPSGPDGCRDCEDRHESCPVFASAYEGYGCEDNPSFMIDVCARSCNTCHLRTLGARCRHLAGMPESLEPGTINETFLRILSIPTVKAEVLSDGPWIVKFPKFLDDEEIEWLLSNETVGRAWKPASDTGDLDEHGRHKQIFSEQRKTDVAWCGCSCHSHPIATRIRARVSELTRVHPDYFEAMQFLRYSPGYYYKAHHDARSTIRKNDPNNVAKHRVYTFFFYLNDVQAGGATRFPRIGLSVQPERGAALLWPSVSDDDPWSCDERTEHEALVVEEGVKLSVNLWLNLGPTARAHYVGCSGGPIDV